MSKGCGGSASVCRQSRISSPCRSRRNQNPAPAWLELPDGVRSANPVVRNQHQHPRSGAVEIEAQSASIAVSDVLKDQHVIRDAGLSCTTELWECQLLAPEIVTLHPEYGFLICFGQDDALILWRLKRS